MMTTSSTGGAASWTLSDAGVLAVAVGCVALAVSDPVVYGWPTSTLSGTLVTIALALCLGWFADRVRPPSPASSTTAPPSAPLATELPMLGHALAYKKDPPGFLLANAEASGGVFTLNLAGFRTVSSYVKNNVCTHASVNSK
jgi:hypothetical protein